MQIELLIGTLSNTDWEKKEEREREETSLGIKKARKMNRELGQALRVVEKEQVRLGWS